jgi:uncharacterized repeat protein (TIGR01451 family)
VAVLAIMLIVTASVSITVISLAQSKRRKAAVTRTAAKTQQRGSARGMSRAGGRGEAESRATGPVKPQERQAFPDVVQMVGAVSQDKDLRDLPYVPVSEEQDERRLTRHPVEEYLGLDPQDPIANSVQPRFPAIAMPTPFTQIAGITVTQSGCGCLPPDTQGDVGPNHYIQSVNSSIKIWDKAGTPLNGTNGTTFNSFFAPMGNSTPCGNANGGDGFVLYDHLADRWVVSDFAHPSFPGTQFYQCVGVSKTSDPVAGGWWLYAVQTDAANPSFLGDYPKFGLWPDAYYLSVNLFSNNTTFNGVRVFALDRSQMVNGGPANTVAFTITPADLGDQYSLVPATFRTGDLPPVGQPEWFMDIDSSAGGTVQNVIYVRRFHVDFANPANSTFGVGAGHTPDGTITVANFVNAVNTSNSTQIVPNGTATTTQWVDTLGDKLMTPLVYQNLGGVESLYSSQSVNNNQGGTGPTSVRWYQFNMTGNTIPATPAQQQTFTNAADGLWRWMPSLAVDASGDLAIGYSASSTTVDPGIRYVGRTPSDAANDLPQGEAVLIAGGGHQTNSNTNGGGRWGDYSYTSIDPVNGCDVWHTNEYYSATSAATWNTRIGAFKFTQCVPQQRGTAHFTITNCVSNAPIGRASVSIDGVPYGGSVTNGTYDTLLAPGAHSYSVTKGGHTVATGNFNITNTQTTNVPVCLDSGTVHFVVTNCATNALLSGAAVTIDGNPVGTTDANGAFDSDQLAGSHTYSVSKSNYSTATGNFNITNGQTTNLPVCLSNGIVHFVVTDCLTNAPLSGASVTIDGNPAGTTAANGTFDSEQLAGNHTYSISKTQYSTATGNFNITNGQTTNTPVCLTPFAQIGLTKTADASLLVAGSSVGYNVTMSNTGSAAATGLSFTDLLPGGAGTNWLVDGANSDAGWSVIGSAPNQSLVYAPATLGPNSSTHVHVISGTSAACAGNATLSNTASVSTTNGGSANASASITVACPPTSTGPVTVTATAGTPGPTDYATVKAAFDAINAGTHQGSLGVWIFGNTTETVPAVLNASGTGSSSYTGILMAPSGGARTVSGAIAAGSPLIDLAGADNVTIDGVNSGGVSLTFSNTTASATASTSTIRLINGATGNTVRNCAINGSSTSSTTTAGGAVLISTSTVAGGNSNNIISNNNIGPAGANLPTKAVLSLGSASPNNNSGNTISGNNIFDFFSPTVTSAGISISSNNTTTTISNNRIYQTAPRTFTTTGLRYNGILFSPGSTGSGAITGNIIGFGAANGTGTTTISGLANTINGIQAPSTSTSVATSIQNNTISGITQTSSTGTTGSGSAFIGISVGATAGLFNIGGTTGNTVGSLDASSAIVLNNTTVTNNSWGGVGLFDFSFQNGDIISNNKVGTITINNGGTGTGSGFRGIRLAGTPGQNVTISNNIIGGTAAGSITDNVVGTYNIYGIDNASANCTCTGNTIRNISANANAAGFIGISGIIFTAIPTGVSTVAQNTIHSLSDNAGANNGAIYALYCNFPSAANVVERNFVHSLSITSTNLTSQIAGILPVAGSGTYKNNMVRLGVDASGNSITGGYVMYGMFEIAGVNNVYHNSVFIGGSGVTASSNTYAFVSNVTTGTRNYVNNIFWNARSNASGAGKNYAITVPGTAPNPAGLTSNYNDLYATGTGGFVGLFNTADQTTLANWQTATGVDANSLSVDPLFVAANGTAATVNLHIQAGSPVLAMGVAGTGVSNDFDNDPRDTPPDIGADEIVAPTIQTTTLTVAPATGTYGGTVNLSATLTVGATPVSGKTINFTLNGNSAGSGVTNGSGVATVSNASLAGINAGTYPTGVGASFAGDVNYTASSGTAQLTVNKATPVITWNNPADIIYGTALSGTQLNATANVPGSFVYTPAAGTVLGYGAQNLHVDFTPTDTTNYNNAQKDVSINVLSALFSMTKNFDRQAKVGYNHNYLIAITNNGNAAATSMTMSDPLPSQVRFTAVTTSQGTCSYDMGTHTVNCTLGTLGIGSTINIQITTKALQTGTLNNTATVTASQWDPATGGNTASVSHSSIAEVDLSVSKTDSADPIYVSQTTTYTIVVKNYNTPISATGVVMTDNLPASMQFISATTSQGSLITPPVNSSGIVTANIGTLAINGTATITITVRATVSGAITNTASASANENEATPANNSASQTTTVNDATLLKVLLANQVLTGGCDNTTGNVYLTGPAPAGGLTVNLSSNVSGATVPASVFIPAGASVSPNFAVTSNPVGAKQVGLITATLGTSNVSRGITINKGSGVCPP